MILVSNCCRCPGAAELLIKLIVLPDRELAPVAVTTARPLPSVTVVPA